MPKNQKQASERRRTAGSLDAVVRSGDRRLIETIQAAINDLKVPESCEGKMSGEYVKCGMALAIQAINAGIEKHNRSAATPNKCSEPTRPAASEVLKLFRSPLTIVRVGSTNWFSSS